MARIVISHFSPVQVNGHWQSIVFYDGLIKALTENGNDVLQIITNDFIRIPWNGTNKLRSGISARKIYQSALDFQPDVVISFNNSTLENLEKVLDVPFVLWDADYFQYFNDKENIKKDKDRYVFFSFSNGSRNALKEAVAPDPNSLHLVKPATALTARAVPPRDNICFIGSFFTLSRKTLRNMMTSYESNPNGVRELIRTFSQDRQLDFDAYAERLKLAATESGLSKSDLMFLSSAERRTQLVAAVAPLGMRIFGPRVWGNIACFSVDAFLSYDPRLAYSLEHNEDIYNRSRIGINVRHSQNVSAYPWRVPDIMATNACLVSDDSEELVKDFGGSVPLQTYRSPSEAREVCAKLLADEHLRADVVAASQEAIRKGFRWETRLREISEILGIRLYDPNAKRGRHEILRPEPFLKPGRRLVVKGRSTLGGAIERSLVANNNRRGRFRVSPATYRRIRKLLRITQERPVYQIGD